MPGINSVYHPFQIDLSFKLYLDVCVYFFMPEQMCHLSEFFLFNLWELWHSFEL